MPRAEDLYHKLIKLGVVRVTRRKFQPPLIEWLPQKKQKVTLDIETEGGVTMRKGDETIFIPHATVDTKEMMRVLGTGPAAEDAARYPNPFNDPSLLVEQT